MRNKIRLISCLLIFICVVCLSGCSNLFSTEDEITYKNVDGGMALSGYEGNSSHDRLDIPDEYEGNPVVEISEYGVSACEYLSYITIGKNVKEISPRAFCGTNKLVSFTVDPENPYFCSVDGVIFSKDMTVLIAYPNYRAKDGAYTIPDGVKTIRSCAFFMCDSLKKVTFPASVEKVEEFGFFKCGGLEHIELNEGLKIVERDGFSFSEGLQELHLPSTIEAIGDYGFYSKTSKITSFTTKKRVEQINCGKNWRPQTTGMENSALSPQYVGE